MYTVCGDILISNKFTFRGFNEQNDVNDVNDVNEKKSDDFDIIL